jgi:hypothetical protein
MRVARFAPLLALLAGAAGLVAGVAQAGPAAPDAAGGAVLAQHGAYANTSVAQAEDARRKRRKKRPGCGRFCRQAGGFGGGDDPNEPVRIRKQRVRVDRDGILTVRATCRLAKKCVGAILIDSFKVSYGRADLRIPARATRKVSVGVSAKAIRYLRRHRIDRTGFATVPLIYNDAPVSVSSTLTILPPR